MWSPEMNTSSAQKRNTPLNKEAQKEHILRQMRSELSDILIGSHIIGGIREDVYDEPSNLEETLSQVQDLIDTSETLPRKEFAKKLAQINVVFDTYQDLQDFRPLHEEQEPLYTFVDTEKIESLMYE